MAEQHSSADGARSPDTPSAATRDAIRAAVMADLAPVRSRSLGDRALLVASAGVIGAALAAVRLKSPDGEPVSVRATVAGVVAVVVTTMAVIGSFAPEFSPKLGARAKLLITATLSAGWATYLVAIAGDTAPASALRGEAFLCAVHSLIAGLIGGGVMFWTFRRADPWTPTFTGGLFGAAAGCVAAAGVGIGCSSTELGHLAVGHGLVVLLLTAVGALAARRLLRP